LAKAVKASKAFADEDRASRANYADEPRDGKDTGGDEGIDLVRLRLKLEAKFAWITKHLLAGPDTPTFATIGSLQYDGYLPPDQAQRLARLVSHDPGSDHDPRELGAFARA